MLLKFCICSLPVVAYGLISNDSGSLCLDANVNCSRWDEMVMMPPGAAESRATQKSVLAGVLYEKQTDPEIGELLEKLQKAELAGSGLDAFQQARGCCFGWHEFTWSMSNTTSPPHPI